MGRLPRQSVQDMAPTLHVEAMKKHFPKTRLACACVTLCAVLAGCNSDSTTLADTSSVDDTPDSEPLIETPAADPVVVNEPPVATSACLQYDTTRARYIGQLAPLSSDPEDDTLNYALADNATRGNVEIDLASGQFIYRPATGERGYLDSFRYSVTDDSGETAEARIDVIVGARRIMPFGDSITAGVTNYTPATGDLPAIPNRVGYRQYLNDELRAAGYGIDFVGSESAGSAAGLDDAEHQGHPGFRTDRLTAGVSAWLDASPADVMLVHVGTNDLSRNAAPLELLLQEIENWQALNHPVHVLISTLIDHQADTFWDDVVEDFNADLRERINNNWPQVTLVDQYSALDNVAHMSPLAIDSVGLHPTAEGYELMAGTWYDSLIASNAVLSCG